MIKLKYMKKVLIRSFIISAIFTGILGLFLYVPYLAKVFEDTFGSGGGDPLEYRTARMIILPLVCFFISLGVGYAYQD